MMESRLFDHFVRWGVGNQIRHLDSYAKMQKDSLWKNAWIWQIKHRGVVSFNLNFFHGDWCFLIIFDIFTVLSSIK